MSPLALVFDSAPDRFQRSMNDDYFFISIGIFFFASLLLAYLRAFRRDQVLKSLEGFQITMEGTDDRLVWGVIHLLPSGIEFRYPQGIEVKEHLETSYILYASDYSSIQALYSYADNLEEAGKARRARDIQRTFHPRPGRRLLRSLRNFTIIASASLNEVMGVFIGRVRKSGVQFISDEGSRALKDLSDTFIGSVGTSFDPLLERVIGQRVVFELVEGDVIHEHVGIFKDYSPDFLMFLDVLYPERKKLVRFVDKVYSKGMTMTKQAFAELNRVLHRQAVIEKWSVIIKPQPKSSAP